MTPAAPPKSTTKNVIVELVLLGLAQTKLKDVGLGAMRGVLLSDLRLAVLDQAVDLQAVWDLLEGQPGFSAELAVGPLCFVKTQEQRLGVTIKLPTAMASLTPEDITKHAATCRPKREEIDRAVAGEMPEKKKSAIDLTTPITVAPKRPAMTQLKKVMLVVAAVATLVSIIVLVHLVVTELGSSVKTGHVDALDFAGEIPLKSAERWGSEIHAVLGDATWMKQPEPKRREQMERALNRLAAKQISTLVITDDTKRMRASAQMFGRPPKIFVRFY